MEDRIFSTKKRNPHFLNWRANTETTFSVSQVRNMHLRKFPSRCEGATELPSQQVGNWRMASLQPRADEKPTSSIEKRTWRPHFQSHRLGICISINFQLIKTYISRDLRTECTNKRHIFLQTGIISYMHCWKDEHISQWWLLLRTGFDSYENHLEWMSVNGIYI